MIPDSSNGLGSAMGTGSDDIKKKSKTKDKKEKKEKKGKKSKVKKDVSGNLLVADGQQVASKGSKLSKISRGRKTKVNAELEATLKAIEEMKNMQ